MLAGQFTAALIIPGVRGQIGLDASASLSMSAATSSASLRARTTTPIIIDAFPWLQFTELAAGGTMTLSPVTSLTQLSLSGGIRLLGVTGNALFEVSAGITVANRLPCSPVALLGKLTPPPRLNQGRLMPALPHFTPRVHVHPLCSLTSPLAQSRLRLTSSGLACKTCCKLLAWEST